MTAAPHTGRQAHSPLIAQLAAAASKRPRVERAAGKMKAAPPIPSEEIGVETWGVGGRCDTATTPTDGNLEALSFTLYL